MNVVTRSYTRNVCFFFVVSLKKKLKVFRYFVIEYHLISYVCFSVCLLVFVFGSKPTNHRSQTLTFWTRLSKGLFPKRSVKMIDVSEKRKRQLVFELHSSRVYGKRSNELIYSVFVKFRDFQREFLRSFSVYRAQIFRDNWNCYKCSFDVQRFIS